MINRYFWVQRPLAILATLSLALVLPVTFFDLLAAALLLAHYTSALWFHPWKKISRAGALAGHLLLVALLSGIALLQFQWRLPIIELYFGLHFVLTELYERTEHAELSNTDAMARGIYYSAVYLYFMQYNIGLTSLATPLLAFTLVALGFVLARTRGSRNLATECAFLLPVFCAYHQPMRFSYVLTYHVMLWWLIPAGRGAATWIRGYWLPAAAFSAGFCLLVFATYFHDESYFWFWRREVTRFGYVHITLSFLMSSLNPLFVRVGFQRVQGLIRSVV